MKFLLELVVYAVAIAVSEYILPGVIIDDIMALVVFAVVLGAINAFVRPVLLFLTLPVTVLTLGLFILVLNALLILLAAWLVPGVVVTGFLWALVFSIVLSLVNALLSGLLVNEKNV